MSESALPFSILRLVLGRLVLFGFAGVLLAGCAPLASVDECTPKLPATFPAANEPPELKQARMEAESAAQLVEDDPKQAMFDSYSAARHSLQALKGLSGDQAHEATIVYDFAVARLIDAVTESKQKPWETAIKLDGPDGPFWLSMTSDSTGTWDPALDKLEVTDRMIVAGKYFPERVCLEGIGAPMVSSGPPRKDPAWAPTKHFVPATALATFCGNKGTIRVVDPSVTSTVKIAGKTRPVAADFSAPVAVLIVQAHPQLLGLLALLDSSKYEKGARLVMMEPYRPGVRPVIFIHGLMDSPLSWVPQINAFNSDPELRKKYQLWYFQYPSGPPFPISAQILRVQLNAIYTKYPETPKAVLVGHSLGGLLSHMMMCDSGTEYCRGIFGKSVAELNLPPSAQVVKDALEFKASPYVARVIFEATPHRGANMAADPLGRIGALLVKLPVKMVALGADLIPRARQTEDNALKRFPNVIDTLRPKALVITSLDKLPLNPHIPFYSIIGDSSNGENKLADSTDDIVAYWSSHLDGAVSEKIVPYSHSDVLKSPEAIAEVRRILLLPN